jgi:hypothetical protein
VRDFLSSLRRDESTIFIAGVRKDFHAMLKSSIQGIGKGNRECRSQQVDIKLEAALGV